MKNTYSCWEAGASVDIPDISTAAQDCAPDNGTLLFIKDCHAHLNTHSNNVGNGV
ncbi:hypothetical protein [Legionella sp. WA2022007384]